MFRQVRSTEKKPSSRNLLATFDRMPPMSTVENAGLQFRLEGEPQHAAAVAEVAARVAVGPGRLQQQLLQADAAAEPLAGRLEGLLGEVLLDRLRAWPSACRRPPARCRSPSRRACGGPGPSAGRPGGLPVRCGSCPSPPGSPGSRPRRTGRRKAAGSRRSACSRPRPRHGCRPPWARGDRSRPAARPRSLPPEWSGPAWPRCRQSRNWLWRCRPLSSSPEKVFVQMPRPPQGHSSGHRPQDPQN